MFAPDLLDTAGFGPSEVWRGEAEEVGQWRILQKTGLYFVQVASIRA